MLQRFLCPTLISREDELSVLEDALLAANRGEQRFVLLEGEAGMGKTRMTQELCRRAQKIGCVVLSGGCSEAEVSLPYLPFVEAIGNYLSAIDVATLTERLGAARRELSQVFPQFADGTVVEDQRDPTQAKLRLFEAIVALLAIPARERGLLLVIEDVHWADAGTREVLDHLARRTQGQRILVLVTFRSDELDRRHPLLPVLQSWRRSGAAEHVRLQPLGPDSVGAMIGSILDDVEVNAEFRDLMHARSEGNPFVLEEMLKEAIDRGDIFRQGGSWDRRSLEDIRIPGTVKDAILLRVGRLEPAAVDVLAAGSAIGRRFDYQTLIEVAAADERTVQDALTVAVAQQLLDEERGSAGSYLWRHALTQEAIYEDTVLPRRQALHSRAADALAKQGGRSVEVAFHLLGAGRFEEAVPVLLETAEVAQRTYAFGEAIHLYERVLPHTGGADRARLVSRLGIATWMAGESVRAEQILTEAIEAMLAGGLEAEAGAPLVFRGRCYWELNRSPEAVRDFERARDLLEQLGPSSDLALAYVRIAGMHGFDLAFDACLEAAKRAHDIAVEADADFERVWSKVFMAMGMMGRGDIDGGIALTEEAYREAAAKGYAGIVSNALYNDHWFRIHFMLGGLDRVVARAEALPSQTVFGGALWISRSGVRRVEGNLAGALEDGRLAAQMFDRLGFKKFAWRSHILVGEVLTELGALEEALRAMPPAGEHPDLQDIAYEAGPQLRLRLTLGELDDAVAIARNVLEKADTLAPFRATLWAAADAFVAAGMIDQAQQLLAAGRAHRSPSAIAALDAAEARVLLATGEPEAAAAKARAAAGAAREAGHVIDALRMLIIAGDAEAATGAPQAPATLQAVVEEASALDAATIAKEALAVAARHDLTVSPSLHTVADAEQEPVPVGERLITSMFADVRGYTTMTAATPPPEMGDRIATLYRWAKAEVDKNSGVVNKFSGDAVMATFNIAGASLDHAVQALRAAMALRDKAALMDLPLGIGIAVGPAVVGHVVEGQDMMVTGVATNLAARLQTAAGGGEILMSEDAFTRAQAWLAERGIEPAREALSLKGFDEPQPAYRIPAPTAMAAGAS